MNTLDTAIVIPFDPGNRNYLVVRATNWHPVPAFRNRLKGIGGLIEPGESPLDAVLRELEEELPGWFIRTPGMSKKFGEIGHRIDAEKGLAYAGKVTGEVRDGQIVWHVYLCPTDLGMRSFQEARRVTTESTPEAWTIGVLPSFDECLPGFRETIEAAHNVIYGAYPSLVAVK